MARTVSLLSGRRYFAVTHDLYLDKVAAAQLPGQAGDVDGLLRIPCAGGVGQKGHPLGI